MGPWGHFRDRHRDRQRVGESPSASRSSLMLKKNPGALNQAGSEVFRRQGGLPRASGQPRVPPHRQVPLVRCPRSTGPGNPSRRPRSLRRPPTCPHTRVRSSSAVSAISAAQSPRARTSLLSSVPRDGRGSPVPVCWARARPAGQGPAGGSESRNPDASSSLGCFSEITKCPGTGPRRLAVCGKHGDRLEVLEDWPKKKQKVCECIICRTFRKRQNCRNKS